MKAKTHKFSKVTFIKTISYFTVMTLLLLACVGCSASEEYGLSITAAAPYVDSAKATAFAEQIKLTGDSNKVSMFSTSIPAPKKATNEVDPNGAAAEISGSANAMKVTAMIASGELDVMLCDVETASRFARGGSFFTLEEIFTEEELSAIPQEKRISYTELDSDNKPTTKMLPECGIDISGNAAVKEFINSEQIGVFVVANVKNKETAKEFVHQLIEGSK